LWYLLLMMLRYTVVKGDFWYDDIMHFQSFLTYFALIKILSLHHETYNPVILLCVSKVGQFRKFPQRDLKHILAYCANNKVFVHFQHPLVFGAWDSGIMARHCNNISNAKSHFPSNCFIAQQAVGCVSLTPSHRSAHFSLAHCWQDNSNTGTMPPR